MGLNNDDNPRELIREISDRILKIFTDLPLIDEYDMYQHLMSYWSNVMQDDVHMIVFDGWIEASKLQQFKGSARDADLIVKKARYKADLLSPGLIVSHYFSDERRGLDELESDLNAVAQEMEDMIEEHGDTDGLLSEVINERGRVTKTAIQDRLKEIKHDDEAGEERDAIVSYQNLMDKESQLKSNIRNMTSKLDSKVLAKYGQLTEEEIVSITVEDKWLAALATSVQGEVEHIGRDLSRRVKELAERYETPLPAIEAEVKALGAKVDEHLRKMGFSW